MGTGDVDNDACVLDPVAPWHCRIRKSAHTVSDPVPWLLVRIARSRQVRRSTVGSENTRHIMCRCSVLIVVLFLGVPGST